LGNSLESNSESKGHYIREKDYAHTRKGLVVMDYDLNADRKRLWFEELRNINESRLIDSLPISLNNFEI